MLKFDMASANQLGRPILGSMIENISKNAQSNIKMWLNNVAIGSQNLRGSVKSSDNKVHANCIQTIFCSQGNIMTFSFT